VLMEMNRLSEAEKEAQAAVKADPKSSQAHDLLGQILAQKAR
jgi:Flp pilus assembly protein TadD